MVSQTAEYGLQAVLFLAKAGGGPAVAQDISDATGVPKGYLHKILRRLGKAGILGSQRGVGGGYVLLKPASQISALEVIRATASTVQTQATNDKAEDPVHLMIERGARRMDELFESTSVQDLIESAV